MSRQHIPPDVLLRARSRGAAGEAWLAGLDDTVDVLARQWNLSIGRVLHGGTDAVVLEAVLPDGRSAVLKLGLPGRDTAAGELFTLQQARGHGYAELYAQDAARGALLLERLGGMLVDSGLPTETQLEIMCTTLQQAWTRPQERGPLMDGAEKARSLWRIITETDQELGQRCSSAVLTRADGYAQRRAQAFDARTAVMAHGDAHPWNALHLPNGGPHDYKFVDPEGLFIERAYDLGILMREWTPELLAGHPVELGVARCRKTAVLTGVDAVAIWEWGFLERTSTALHAMNIGLEGGKEMLAVSEAWVDAGPA